MRRTKTPKPIWIKFCMVVDIADVVTYTNFSDHRLRAFWVAGGQISPSLIDFHRRPYNTLALPCEHVISSRKLHDNQWIERPIFYKTNRFESTRITNRIDSNRELECSRAYFASPRLTTTDVGLTTRLAYDRVMHTAWLTPVWTATYTESGTFCSAAGDSNVEQHLSSGGEAWPGFCPRPPL